MEVAQVLIFSLLVVLPIAAFAHHREPSRRARFPRRVGFWFTTVCIVLFGLFLTGETLSDPGGWKGIGLVAMWLVPLAALCVATWLNPNRASWFLDPLVVAVVGLSVWFAADPQAWRAFENQNGPVRVVVILVLCAPLAIWGLRRTMQASVALLVIGLVPIVIAGATEPGGLSSLAVVSYPPLITGLLYLVAAYEERRRRGPALAVSGHDPKAG